MIPKSFSSISVIVALSGIVLIIFGILLPLISASYITLGWLVTFFGGAVNAYATMIIARKKGRSPYLGLLVVIGFIIVLLLKPKTKTLSNPVKFTLVEGLLTIGLTLSLIAFSNIYIFVLAGLPEPFARSLFPNQFLITPLIALICVITALMLNKRHASTLGGFFYVGFLFWLLNSVFNAELQLHLYMQARNLGYFLLLTYAILHILILSISKVWKRNVNVFTPEGILSWFILLQFFNYLYVLVNGFKH